MKNGLAKGTASFPMELVWQMVTQVRTRMRHEITGRDNRSTRHNSVTKGEFLSLTVSGGPGVSFEHPSESATVS